MSTIIFSGIQPSGDLHLGNYIGAIRHWVRSQDDGLNIFCIVDLHAITVPQDPAELHEKNLELTAWLLAAGIDPKKSILFIQSHNLDHANLGWVLNCFISMGQLRRMTQFKEKSESKDFVSVGLFDYPVLMAADILLYDVTEVPVGDDQRQHVELTRDVAGRFNSKHGEIFVLPKPVIPEIGGRVMSLIEPTKKMSKSDKNDMSKINLLDAQGAVTKKIMNAVTDSGNEIKYDVKAKPGVSNLIEIYSQVTDRSIDDVVKEFNGKNYGEFKKRVAEAIVGTLVPMQERYKKLREGGELESVLKEGAQKAYKLSHPKLVETYKRIGFVTND